MIELYSADKIEAFGSRRDYSNTSSMYSCIYACMHLCIHAPDAGRKSRRDGLSGEDDPLWLTDQGRRDNFKLRLLCCQLEVA